MAFIKEFADKMGYVGDKRVLLSANASIAERFRNNYVDLAFKLDLAKDMSIFIKGTLANLGSRDLEYKVISMLRVRFEK